MDIAIIGRTEILYDTAKRLSQEGHTIRLVITAKEAPEYTKNASDFRELADSLGAVFCQTPHIEEVQHLIQSIPNLDVGISLNYSAVIPKAVTDLFPLGILNAHGGDLPRYRGNACQAWAIINKEEKVGLCIHRMLGGELDSGDIIARDYYSLSLHTKITDIHSWMSNMIPCLFSCALSALQENSSFILEKQSKNPADALRCYPRRPEDGRINWDNSAVDILRLINASNKPYAGAFCHLDNCKLIIWDASLSDDNENYLAVAGQVTKIEAGYIEVATGDGKLIIKNIELEEQLFKPDKVIKSIRVRLT